MRYLSIKEVLDTHERLLENTGGMHGIRDIGALESAVSQPRVTYGGHDLYPDIIAKAAALCYSLVMNHAFVDGNKRIGHAAMEIFLILNGLQIECNVDEQEDAILKLAAGEISRKSFTEWVRQHTTIA